MNFKKLGYLVGIITLVGNFAASWSMAPQPQWNNPSPLAHSEHTDNDLVAKAQILNTAISCPPYTKVLLADMFPQGNKLTGYLVPRNRADHTIYRAIKLKNFFGVENLSPAKPLLANLPTLPTKKPASVFDTVMPSSIAEAWKAAKSKILPQYEDNQTWRIEPKKVEESFNHLLTFKERHPKAVQIWRNFRNDTLGYGALVGLNRGLMHLKASNVPLPQVLLPAATAVGAIKTPLGESLATPPFAWDALQNSVNQAYSHIKPVQEALENYPIIENAMNLWGHSSEIAKIACAGAILARIASNLELINWTDKFYELQDKILHPKKSWLPKKTLLVGGFAAVIYGMARYNNMTLEKTLHFSANNKVLMGGATAIVSTLLPLSLQGINYLDNAVFGQSEAIKEAIKDFSFGEIPVLTKGSFTGKLPEKLEEIADMVKNPIRYEDIKNSNKADKSDIAPSFLLVGPPGTGKTMIAQQLGRQIKAGYVFIDATKLNSGTVGEGIKYLDKTFEHIQEMLDSGRKKYCVLFIDEIDAIGKRHTVGEGDRGVTQENNRVVIKLLTLLNDLDPRIILIAATNKPDELDDALLRNGRISDEITVGLPSEQERYELLAHYLRDVAKKRKISMDVTNDQLSQIATATEGVSKGYFMMFAKNALRAAHKRGSSTIETKDLSTAYQCTKNDKKPAQHVQPAAQNTQPAIPQNANNPNLNMEQIAQQISDLRQQINEVQQRNTSLHHQRNSSL